MALLACSKAEKPAASGNGADDTARSAEHDSGAVVSPPERAVGADVPARTEGRIVHDSGGELWQASFEASVPTGWKPDEALGPYAWAAAGEPDGPSVYVTGYTCWPGLCDPAIWTRPEAPTEGIELLRKGLLDERRGILVERRDGDDMVTVDHLPSGAPRIALRCAARAPTGSALFDKLVESCSTLRVRPIERWLSGERLAVQRAKLAGCPTSSVRLTVRDKENVSFLALPFGAVMKSGAVQEMTGKLVIRLSDSGAEDALGEWRSGNGSLRLDIAIEDRSPTRSELTSGLYRGSDDLLLSAELYGASTLPEDGKRLLGDKTSFGFAEADSVEIVARTPDRICGRFSFHEEGGDVSGEFDVALEVRPLAFE